MAGESFHSPPPPACTSGTVLCTRAVQHMRTVPRFWQLSAAAPSAKTGKREMGENGGKREEKGGKGGKGGEIIGMVVEASRARLGLRGTTK